MPLHKVLTQSHHEAFGQDSHLVRKMREENSRSHCTNLNNENPRDFTDVFWCMVKTVGLLGSAIYEIKEAWTGQDELWQANYVPKVLPKGLKFFRAVSPTKSPKVMGLKGIHDPDVLCHVNGLTHCPWCGKEGQNEGTHSQPPVDGALWGWVLYARNTSAAHPSCWRPSTVMARKTANPQGREVQMSHPHQPNY